MNPGWEQQLPILQHNCILFAGNYFLVLHASSLKSPSQACALEINKLSQQGKQECEHANSPTHAYPHHHFTRKHFSPELTSGNSSWQQNAASLAKGAALRWWHRSRRTTLQSYLHKRSEPPAMLRLITMLQHKRAPGFGKEWMVLVLYAPTRLASSP